VVSRFVPGAAAREFAGRDRMPGRGIIERHSHGIIVGRLLSMELSHRLSGLVYWNGQYVEIDHDTDWNLLAEVGIPLAHAR